ncbi:tRNA synthetases class I (M)-domain-containing protein [Staphylotrichum tortipilum]|uniref:methionine--tRNA ligase n=1 Tax=Staphylotrichum tortipilum TaxID=2831512 RepID=A0AAN6MEV8_9PEZI|nr:tRNA synthetases class I (M)-domain-containing protein [Staphylotrichum longicolle]
MADPPGPGSPGSPGDPGEASRDPIASREYNPPESYRNLDDSLAPIRAPALHHSAAVPLPPHPHHSAARRASIAYPASGADYDVPDTYVNLGETSIISPVQNPYEQPIRRFRSLEQVRGEQQEFERDQRRKRRESIAQGLPLEPETPSGTKYSVSRLATQLYTVSYLVFFSILGTLARLGLQSLTTYPGTPILFHSIWPNFTGSLIMGYLSEDRMLFREDDSGPAGGSSSSADEENPANAAAAAKKTHAALKKTIPLYIGLATGFCGSLTSFSAFMRDAFLGLSNTLPSPTAQHEPRDAGTSFAAVVAVLLTTLSLSLSGLFLGAHLAIACSSWTAPFPRTLRRLLDVVAVPLGWGCWLGAVFMSAFPPKGHKAWRGEVTLALVFAPLGCLARFYISLALNGRVASFPLGTFVVNMAGTGVLAMAWDLAYSGVPAGVSASGAASVGCQMLAGVQDGFCGCLTTVSTWVGELAALRRRHAYAYGATSLFGGLAIVIAVMGGVRWSGAYDSGACGSADVFARFCRARGLPTVYICGSDEYGTATETKALAEGVDPATLCAKYHAIHKEIYDWFRIDFDVFGRTPTPEHTSIVQDVFTRLWNNGFVEQRETTQAYCPTHSSFLADRYVEGECSLCHDKGARGDQCDACGNLLDPLEPDLDASGNQETKATGWLINPRCKLDGTTPERRQTKHLYLRLDTLQPEIKAWLDTAEQGWSANCVSITHSWLDQGLKPRGITRDLKWGVPIPAHLDGLSDEDYAKKVFYVCFHTIIWPASQIGSGENWTKVNHLSTTEYLNYEGGKFSKSKGVGVFGNNARDTGVDADIWRYYLLSRRPETSDSEFKWEEFLDANNNDLLKNLGNLCQRIIKFCQAKMDGVIPEYDLSKFPALQQHKEDVDKYLQEYITNLKAVKLRAGLSTIMSISGLGNKLLQDNKLGNQLIAEEPDRCRAVVGIALNHVHLLANILAPYMPEKSQSILRQLGFQTPSEGEEIPVHIPDTWEADALKPGHAVGTPELLFANIPAAKIDEWRDAFGGEELRKQKEIEAEKAAAKKAAREKEKEKKKLKKAAAAAQTAQEGQGATTTLPLRPAPTAQVVEAPANPAEQIEAAEGVVKA